MPRLFPSIAVVLLIGAAVPVLAQHQGARHPANQHHSATAQPYAGLGQREVTALSDVQLADLRAGRGMGLALPAELNGYPGPMHTLDLADALGLDAHQREALQRQVQAMRDAAIAVGERVIAAETALDRAFADRRITPVTLADLTAEAGAAQAALRATHLKYHLDTAALLSQDQRDRYAALRGYR